MGRWTKKALPMTELLRLGLTPEEGFVLSRLDVALSPPEVVSATGIPIERVEEILGNLGSKGAVLSDRPDDPLLIADDPEPVPRRPFDPRAEPDDPEPAPVLEPLPEPEPVPELEPLQELEPVAELEPLQELEPAAELEELEPAAEATAGLEIEAEAPPALESEGEEPAEGVLDEAPEAEDPQEALDDLGYRKMYETELRKLERDERLTLAKRAKDPQLLALCFDLDPHVIQAILDNPQSGLRHARLAARHHGTSAGLEHIAKRAPILGDPQVQRALLRNPQLTEVLCKKILMPKRMPDSYKATIDVDIPERTRAFARGVLRGKFAMAQGEERAGLISSTEGRVLAVLTGLTLDGRATAILAARTYTSVLFVQNLARWGACPPVLLAHLLKQPLVRRQQHLRNMVLRHPNVPADAKRKM